MTSTITEQIAQLHDTFREKLDLNSNIPNQKLVEIFDEELSARSVKLSAIPTHFIYEPFTLGLAGVSLSIDTVGFLAEYFIALHRTPTGELGRRTHFWVDLWGRAEASRALQLELLTLWQSKPPAQRISVFQDGVKFLISECLAVISSEQESSTKTPNHSIITTQLNKLVSGIS